jgi:hypothetical protein
MGTSRDPQRASHRVAALSSLNVSDRLDSWKEIATYLKRTVRTVQRWEKREGLPVHGHFHLKSRNVYGLKDEIDVWLTVRGQNPSKSPPMQRRLGQVVNGLNPLSQVMKQMFAAIHLWIAMGAQEPFRGFANAGVADARMSNSAGEI